MGVLSLMGIVKTGFSVAFKVVGMYPEKNPVTFGMLSWIGSHGLAKLAWTTE